MNSAEKKKWAVTLAGPARKSLERVPPRDRARVRAAIDEMETDAFQSSLARG
jgi:mRNA-degrading endonuclease RelE of RelBE toxin-antitoxin system